MDDAGEEKDVEAHEVLPDTCPSCGSKLYDSLGTDKDARGIYTLYRCDKCGRISRH